MSSKAETATTLEEDTGAKRCSLLAPPVYIFSSLIRILETVFIPHPPFETVHETTPSLDVNKSFATKISP